VGILFGGLGGAMLAAQHHEEEQEKTKQCMMGKGYSVVGAN
jgi:hypothetical protein